MPAKIRGYLPLFKLAAFFNEKPKIILSDVTWVSLSVDGVTIEPKTGKKGGAVESGTTPAKI